MSYPVMFLGGYGEGSMNAVAVVVIPSRGKLFFIFFARTPALVRHRLQTFGKNVLYDQNKIV